MSDPIEDLPGGAPNPSPTEADAPSVPTEFLVTPEDIVAGGAAPEMAPATTPSPQPEHPFEIGSADDSADFPEHEPAESQLTGREIGVAIVLTLLILIVGIGVFQALVKMRPNPKRQASLATFTAVRVQTVTAADLQESLTGYGRARAVRSSNVAATVGGTVQWISPKCEAGSWVEQGEVLVRLDPRELKSALDTAKARSAQAAASLARARVDQASIAKRLAVATEELELAQTEYDRLKSLSDSVTRSQLDGQYLAVSLRRRSLLQLQRESDSAGPAVASAAAEEAAAKAGEARAQLDFDRAEMRAPFAGEIGERLVHEGQRIMSGAPLFQLTDSTRIEVPVAIAARHYGEVQLGAKLTLRARSDGDPLWSGTVARIAPRIDDMDRTFFIYAEVASPAPANGGRVLPVIAPGAFVIGEVEGPLHAKTTAVPRSAFINGRAYIATPATVVAYVASEATVRTPEEREAQAAQLKGIAEQLGTLMGGVPGCGTVDPPAGSGVQKVSAAFAGTAAGDWEAVTERVREAVRAGNILQESVTITVGVEALVTERLPTITRRLPEVALVSAGLAVGELLVVTNLQQVAEGGRVRLVGDASEQVSGPKPAAPAGESK